MKKIYYLSSCSTCLKIMKELKVDDNWEQQDIKLKNISAKELDKIAKAKGTYEAIFSRRAMKFRSWGLNEKQLNEKEYRKYMLEEYTFLKRPFIIIGKEIFVGNTKSEIAAAKKALGL